MSERARNLLIVGVILVMSVVIIATVTTSPAHQDRVESLGSRIKCPVCQGESIADSPAAMAADMMDLIGERVAQGASDDSIIDELLSSYSGAVLLDPPLSGNTLPLWLAPILVTGLGAGIILWWRSHPGVRGGPEPLPTGGRKRALVGGVILTGLLALIVVIAANSLQDRSGAAIGVADLGDQDISEVSNETLEAVIAANADNPQIDGMRLALADRYYQTLDYRSAFPHYLAVAESPTASPAEASAALIRLGWMAYDGNGEVETALSLLDSALEIDPASQVGRYLKGTVLWCGAADNAAAADLFAALLDDPGLAEDTRQQVQTDLDLVSAGETCA